MSHSYSSVLLECVCACVYVHAVVTHSGSPTATATASAPRRPQHVAPSAKEKKWHFVVTHAAKINL